MRLLSFFLKKTCCEATQLLYSKTGVYRGIHYFFLFLLKNIDCGYSWKLFCWSSSNKYSQSMFSAEIWKISEFLSKNLQFLVVEYSIYSNRRIFLMRLMQHYVGVQLQWDADKRLIGQNWQLILWVVFYIFTCHMALNEVRPKLLYTFFVC